MRLLALSVTIALGACSADAQPGRRSPRGTVTQTVNGTEISMRYYRPVLRARVAFTSGVSWGRTRTAGRDRAERIANNGKTASAENTLPAGSAIDVVNP